MLKLYDTQARLCRKVVVVCLCFISDSTTIFISAFGFWSYTDNLKAFFKEFGDISSIYSHGGLRVYDTFGASLTDLPSRIYLHLSNFILAALLLSSSAYISVFISWPLHLLSFHPLTFFLVKVTLKCHNCDPQTGWGHEKDRRVEKWK